MWDKILYCFGIIVQHYRNMVYAYIAMSNCKFVQVLKWYAVGKFYWKNFNVCMITGGKMFLHMVQVHSMSPIH